MAKQARGYRAQMVMGFEQTYGEIPSSATGWTMPFNTESLVISRPKNTAATLRGTRNPAEPFDGNTDVAGDIVVPVDAGSFGLWLKALFGQPVSAAVPDSDPATYTHTFKTGEELLSFWLEERIATDAPFWKRSTGVKINSMQIEVGGDQELTATINCMGSRQSNETTASVASPDDLGLNRLSNFMATLKVDGAEVADVVSFSLQLQNGLDGDNYTLGKGGIRGDLPEGLLSVSGSMVVLLKDDVFYRKALDAAPLAFELALKKADGAALSFSLPESQLEVSGPTVEGPAGMRVTWNYQSYSSQATDSVVTAVLTNTIADY